MGFGGHTRGAFPHDTRAGKKDFPIKIRIQHNREKVYLNTGVRVAPEQWDAENGAVIDHPQARTFNILLGAKFKDAQEVLTNLELSRKVNKYTAAQLKEIIENDGELAPDSSRDKFRAFYISCMNAKKKESTRSSYQQALNNLDRFDPILEERYFEDIDIKYLQKLDAWFEERNVSVNARAVYYRNIKSVFNDAIDENLTTEYPFRRFKIKTTPTKKRNISVQELRMLRDYPIKDEFQRKYRDIFMLCFYLRGINMVDLLRMTPKDIRLNRLNYIRAKTGKPYSVYIEPEAWEIINSTELA